MFRTVSPMVLRLITCALLIALVAAAPASSTEPCGDFGECKVLVEINSTDGDIGFHFLMDGSDLRFSAIFDPNLQKVFSDRASGALREQGLTETFAESAEPLCWNDPEADPDEEIVTLEEFLERWTAGPYYFFGFDNESEFQFGETTLGFELPAAPQDVDFEDGVISWEPGEDLGNCADAQRLDGLVSDGDLPVHPRDVAVQSWEVVLEPDVDDGDPTGALIFSIRVPGDINPPMVTVPADYLASLPVDTPVKIEVGAIGVEDNATFSEEDGFCVNELDGCEEEDE